MIHRAREDAKGLENNLIPLSDTTKELLGKNGLTAEEIDYLGECGFRDARVAVERLGLGEEGFSTDLCLARISKQFGWQTVAVVGRSKDNSARLVAGGGIKLKPFGNPVGEETLRHLLAANVEAATAMALKFSVAGPFHDVERKKSIGGAKLVAAIPNLGQFTIAARIYDIVHSLHPVLKKIIGTAGDENAEYGKVRGVMREQGFDHPQQGIVAGLGQNVAERSQRLDDACEITTGVLHLGRVKIVDVASAYTTLITLKTIAALRNVPLSQVQVTVQGTGQIGKALLALLAEHGVNVVAIGSANGIVKSAGDGEALPVAQILGAIKNAAPKDWDEAALERLVAEGVLSNEHVEHHGRLPLNDSLSKIMDGRSVDALLVCAGAHAVDEKNQERVARALAGSPLKAVISAANNGITRGAERSLRKMGLVVPPDFVVNSGVARVFGQQMEPVPLDLSEASVMADLKATIEAHVAHWAKYTK